MPNPPADLPKFKRIHKALWNQMLAQKQIDQYVGQAIDGRATAHERECLERVRAESRLALEHINEAIQQLFETANSPTDLAKHKLRRMVPGDRSDSDLFGDDRDR